MKHSNSKDNRRRPDRADYGFARARDLAFDAVRHLWSKRQSEGLTKADIARILERDPAWVSRQLSGPGNWTLRTIGELTEAMGGELEIFAHPIETPRAPLTNFDAYAAYPRITLSISPAQGMVGNLYTGARPVSPVGKKPSGSLTYSRENEPA